MLRRWMLFSLFASLVLLLAGCPTTFPRPENALSSPIPALEQIERNIAGVQDVQWTVKGTYFDEKNGKRVAGRPVDVLAKNPASFYIEVGSGFGKALGALASDGVHFYMLDMQNNVFYRGPATSTNLSMLLPLYLPGDDFVRMMRGGFPLSSLDPRWREEATLEWNKETGRYRMVLPLREGGTQTVELTHPDLGVAEVLIRDADGKGVYLYQAKDFKNYGGAPLPMRSHFELIQQSLDVEFDVEAVEINVGMTPEIFVIDPPPGLEQRHLDANGNIIRTTR